jgi:hypothetical protein
MLLIYDDEKLWGSMSESERQVFAEYGAYTQELRDKGAYLAAAH